MRRAGTRDFVGLINAERASPDRTRGGGPAVPFVPQAPAARSVTVGKGVE